MNFQEYPVTYFLLGANIVISLIGFSNADFLNKTILWPFFIKRKHEYWRMITSGFLHADYMHLFFNMFTLYFFGKNIEILFEAYGLGGKAMYIALYFGALIISDLPSTINHKDDYHYRALGASGAVSAIVFAAIIFNPWGKILLYGAIGISALLYAVLFVAYSIYMGKQNADNVNHDAHLWGALFGVAFTVILISFLQPALFELIVEELKHPSLFGR